MFVRHLLVATLLYAAAAGCTDAIAPIAIDAPTCQSDDDCQPARFCHRPSPTEDGRCLKAGQARCGDGLVRSDIAEGLPGHEACDDGNRDPSDGCTRLCQLATCGDGVHRLDLAAGDPGYEGCDDGNSNAQDGCTNACALARCGDGHLRDDLPDSDAAYEACDDGNDNNLDACTNACTLAVCGDGITRDDRLVGERGYEACDDGDEDELDRCDNRCRVTICGDVVTQTGAGEECDDGNDDDQDDCLNDCQRARCGDGVVRMDLALDAPDFESCDDGNAVDDDACPNDCRAGPIALASGRNFSCFLLANGRVYCFGGNRYGQSRPGGEAYTVGPQMLPGLTDVVAIGADSQHTCALRASGNALCWGYRHDGLEAVSHRVPWVDLAVGGDFVCGLDAQGQIWCAGGNSHGQLGQPELASEVSEAVQVAAIGPASKVALGTVYGCALDRHGAVWCWGYNDTSGQLGRGPDEPSSATPRRVPGLTGVEQLVVWRGSACALSQRDDRQLIECWGQGFGSVPMIMHTLPDRVEHLFSGSAGGDAGRYFVFVQSSTGQLLKLRLDDAEPFGDFGGVTALAPGWSHDCALSSDGRIFCWGDNGSGQLGQSSATHRLRPHRIESLEGVTSLALGIYHSCALLHDETVRCWGWDRFGQFGAQGHSPAGSPPVVVETSQVTQLVAGGLHNCSRHRDQTVSCWGSSTNGRRGVPGFNGDHPVAVENLSQVVELVAGWSYTLARTTGQDQVSTVYGWGDFSGYGREESILEEPAAITELPPTQSMAAARSHACALLADHRVVCWGDNTFNQLGVLSDFQPLEPANNGDPNWVDGRVIPGLSDTRQVHAGEGFTCSIDAHAAVRCWGDNGIGQLGVLSQDNLAFEPIGGLRAVALATGRASACAISEQGDVLCWGNNATGQLGDGTRINRNEPTLVAGLPAMAQVAAGSGHTCALAESGQVFCWGYNNTNQVGDGHIASSAEPLEVRF